MFIMFNWECLHMNIFTDFDLDRIMMMQMVIIKKKSYTKTNFHLALSDQHLFLSYFSFSVHLNHIFVNLFYCRQMHHKKAKMKKFKY